MIQYAMKKVVLISTLLLLLPLVSACKDKPRNPVKEYGNAVINSYKKAQDAAETANFELIKRAIQQFHAANGEYPASLKDLGKFIGIKINADMYEYDPRTGTITLR
jgi:outer membrane protein assembly factor BamD (BamD/ComL family)